MSRLWSVVGVVCASSLVTGCGQPSGPASTGAPVTTEAAKPAVLSDDAASATGTTDGDAPVAASEAAEVAATPEWRTAVQLTEGTWADTEKRIGEHRGKIVVLDVWSTACEPCLRELPNLIALQEKHPGEIVCVALNSDYAGVRKKPPEFYRERVQKVLEEKDAKVLNVLCTEPADELFTALKIDSIPAVFVYGRDGEVAAKFDHRTTDMGEFTYAEHVEPVVQKLMASTDNGADDSTPVAP